MRTTLETPNQLLERLDRMGLDHVRNLLTKNHFAPKTLGLVQGWIDRKEEQRNPTPPPEAPKPDPAVQEALRTARQALRETRKVREAAAKTQRLAIIAIATASAGILVSILSLFATAIR